MRRPGESEKRPGDQRFDQSLVTRFVAGERDAFDGVFQELKQDMFFVVRRFFRSPFDQEEAFQEVWLQLHRMRGRFDVNRHQEFVGWARQVARNRCIDIVKAKTRRPEVPVEEIERPQEASQLKSVVGQRVRRQLEEFVGSLDSQQRQFFGLCFGEELSHEEIAAQLSITVRRSKYLKKKILARMLRNSALKRAAMETP